MIKLPFYLILLLVVTGDLFSGSIKLLTPIGGEAFIVHEPLTVEWEADSTVTQVKIRLTMDNGVNYWSITEDPINRQGNAEWGHWEFLIPTYLLIFGNDTIFTTSDSCRIIVENYTGEEYDRSAGMFSIRPEGSGRESRTERTLIQSALFVWPNPADHNSIIHFQRNGNQKFPITVYDLSGRKVFSTQTNNGIEAVAASTFGPGVFLVRYVLNPSSLISKIIVY